jgi:aminopeptidase-like protein
MLESESTGETLYSWAKDLFPICRSLTGPGVRETLSYFKEILPELEICSVPTGTKAFDWVVPDEWSIEDAYIENDQGDRIVNFKDNNLHVVGYSEPVNKWMDLDMLNEHLHSLPDQPTAIPYVTSYYTRTWGFCLAHNKRKSLKKGLYHIVINSKLKSGVLNYGELIIKGKTNDEVLLSTYVCHPSMGNNELSGPVVTAGISQWINTLKGTRYTYRIIFIPETIGSIVYLSKHSEYMKSHTIAGLVLTCIGDNKDYSLLPSKTGDTLIDRISSYALRNYVKSYTHYSYLDRGSDERQYCSPGIDLPVCSVMRSKYLTYPEYHTSLDDLSLISSEGLQGGFDIVKKIIRMLECNQVYISNILCEPQLSNYDLYPRFSVKNSKEYNFSKVVLNVLAYTDGENDILKISKIIGADFFTVHEVATTLTEKGLLRLKK